MMISLFIEIVMCLSLFVKLDAVLKSLSTLILILSFVWLVAVDEFEFYY